MSTLFQDLRYAARMLWHNPGFTIVAVLALALGIGATSAIFSVVDAVLLRPLPFAESQQLMYVGSAFRGRSGVSSFPDLMDLRTRNHVFTDVAAYADGESVLTGGDPQVAQVLSASPNLLRVLRVNPMLGRTFSDSEAFIGNRVVMLSYELWQSRYGGDPNIVGRTIGVDGEANTVIGVAPRGFRFPLELGSAPPQLLMIFPREKEDERAAKSRGSHFLRAVARLKPGMTPAQASADLDTVSASLRHDYPAEREDKHLDFFTHPFHEHLVRDTRPALIVLLVAVAFVLLIACANVANLLLARASARQREIAIRSALGAGRSRIVRQMLTESALLGLVGGGIGVLLALWLVDLLVALGHSALPHLHDVVLDGRVLLFTFAIALATGIGFGLWPALHASRTDLNEALKETARSTAHARSRRARSTLLVAEIAIALVLLTGAGLALRSFSLLTNVDPGFRAHGLVMAQLWLPGNRYFEKSEQNGYYRRAAAQLEALPGIDSIAYGYPLPFSSSDINLSVNMPGQPANPAMSNAAMYSVSPNFFATMGVPLKRGRTFTSSDDRLDAPATLVISESFARALFPHEEALGKHVVIGYDSTECEIVGIVGEMRRRKLDEDIFPTMYTPMGRTPFGAFGVVARGKSPQAIMPLLRKGLLAVDKELPPPFLETMDNQLAESLRGQRVVMILLALFAVVAVILTCVGVYGVTAYTVTQRTREIGIRVALGASDGAVVSMIVGEGLRLSLLAVAIGVGGAVALARLARTLFYGVGAFDPLTLVPMVLLLLGVTALACLVPARRAARVDPMVALRYE
jgi:putative ABC transport system permease protein